MEPSEADGDKIMSTLALCLETTLVALLVFVPLLCLLSKSFRFYLMMSAYGICVVSSCMVSSLLSLPYGRNTNNHYRIFHSFQLSLRWLGLEVTLRNPENIESSESFVMIANHQSALDVFTMTHCWPKNCVSLLKSSLKYVPFFNLCTYLCHAVYIDRFNRTEAKNSLSNVMDAIKNHKKGVHLSEGSRHASLDEEFLPFKMGAFVIAKRAEIPIVPVVFSSYQPFYDYATKKFDRHGLIVLEALEPIDSMKYDTVDELAEECRKRMQETYRRLNAEVRKAHLSKH